MPPTGIEAVATLKVSPVLDGSPVWNVKYLGKILSTTTFVATFGPLFVTLIVNVITSSFAINCLSAVNKRANSASSLTGGVTVVVSPLIVTNEKLFGPTLSLNEPTETVFVTSVFTFIFAT